MQQLSLLGDDEIAVVHVKRAKPVKKSTPVIEVTKIAIDLEPIGAPDEPESKDSKDSNAFKNISEAAKTLDVPQHVLRFWESRFTQIKPLKLRGGRRYYRPEDMEILTTIKNLLYKQGYTIEGAKKAFNLLRGRKPAAASKTKPPAIESAARVLTDKKRKQISAIREELIGLRQTLQATLAVPLGHL